MVTFSKLVIPSLFRAVLSSSIRNLSICVYPAATSIVMSLAIRMVLSDISNTFNISILCSSDF
jgi:hypothetical protein